MILAGDDMIVLATIAGARRYYRNVSLVYMDRDADLNVPATTSSGCVDGMVISHVIGRGAPELTRFWNEPPLVREPDVAVFGIERVDEPEQRLLGGTPLQRYLAVDIKGAARRSRRGSAREAAWLAARTRAAARSGCYRRRRSFAATNFPGQAGCGSMGLARRWAFLVGNQP